jgi:hypothetical protein
MKFSNIATFFSLPTLSDVANIYNDNNEINDEIQTGNIIQDGIMISGVN